MGWTAWEQEKQFTFKDILYEKKYFSEGVGRRAQGISFKIWI